MQIENKIDKLSDYIFFGLILILPLIFSRYVADNYLTIKWAVLFIVGSYIVLYQILFTNTLKKTSIFHIFIFTYFLINILSIFVAINIHESFRQITKLFFLLVIAMFVRDRSNKNIFIERLIFIISITLLPISIYGICQYLGYDFLTLEKEKYVASTLGNSNYVAQYIAETLPLILLGFIISTNYKKIWWGFIFTISLLCLLLTESRGGVLAFSGSMVIFILLYLLISYKTYSKKIISQKIFHKKIYILLFIIGMIIVSLALGKNMNALKDIKTSFGKEGYTNQFRLLLWKDSLSLIKDFPKLGVGAGNFKTIFPKYTSNEFWKFKNNYDIVRTTYTHNDYLQITSETGIIGLIAFLSIIGYIFFRTISLLINKNIDESKVITVIAFLCAVLATLAHSVVDFNLYNPASALIFWVSIGAIDGINLQPNNINTQRENIFRNYFIMLLIFILLNVFLLKDVIGGHYHQLGKNEFEKKNYSKAIEYLTKAENISQNNINVLIDLSNAYRNAKLYDTAINYYLILLKLDPHYSTTHNRLGVCYIMGPKNIFKAKQEFQKAIEINPYNVLALINFGNIYYKEKLWERAIFYYTKAYREGSDTSQYVLINSADCYYELKNYRSALAIYQKLLEKDKNNSFILWRINKCKKEIK